jgi:hypothetical protein
MIGTWKGLSAGVGAVVGLLAAGRARAERNRRVCRRMAAAWVDTHLPLVMPVQRGATLETADVDLD